MSHPTLFRIVLGLIVAIAGLIAWARFVKLNAFFALVSVTLLFLLISGTDPFHALDIARIGLTKVLPQIALVIALGSVLGMFLEKTNAMEAISSGLLKLVGSGRSVLALSIVGGLVGIPVFCDSGFIVLSKLIGTLAQQSATAEGSLVLALSSSLYTTHSLIPPTPGPLAASVSFGLANEIGLVIAVGLLTSIPVIAVTYWYAKKFGARIKSNHNVFATGNHTTPSFAVALSPLGIPIILISAATFFKMDSDSMALSTVAKLGQPPIALSVGILFVLCSMSRKDFRQLPEWTARALKDAAMVILIVGAGIVFGGVIRSSGLDEYIAAYASKESLSGAIFLCFAWLIGALFKTAQGSTTSSMVISGSIIAPLAAAAGLHSALQSTLVVMAIGGGAMTVSHGNDAYFWVVSRFGNVSSSDAFRWYTPMTLLQGLTVLTITLILSVLL